MKLARMFLSAIVLSVVTMLAPACQPAKTVGKVTIDVALAVCVAENVDKAAPEVAMICGAADALLPIIRDLLAAQRSGAVKLGAPPYTGK